MQLYYQLLIIGFVTVNRRVCRLFRCLSPGLVQEQQRSPAQLIMQGCSRQPPVNSDTYVFFLLFGNCYHCSPLASWVVLNGRALCLTPSSAFTSLQFAIHRASVTVWQFLDGGQPRSPFKKGAAGPITCVQRGSINNNCSWLPVVCRGRAKGEGPS